LELPQSPLALACPAQVSDIVNATNAWREAHDCHLPIVTLRLSNPAEERIPLWGLNAKVAVLVLSIIDNVPTLDEQAAMLVGLTATLKLVFGASVRSCHGFDCQTSEFSGVNQRELGCHPERA